MTQDSLGFTHPVAHPNRTLTLIVAAIGVLILTQPLWWPRLTRLWKQWRNR